MVGTNPPVGEISRNPPVGDPDAIYEQRLNGHRRQERSLEDRALQISWARLIVFVIGATSAWLAFVSHRISGLWFLMALIAFVSLVVLHERVIRRRIMAGRRAAYCRERLARISRVSLHEMGAGSRFRDDAHPYAIDLDLFGDGSLFAILSSATTAAGETRLADWLTSGADIAEIRRRHEAVEDLADRVELREDLAVIAETIVAGLDLESLDSMSPVPGRGRITFGRIIVAFMLGLANGATLLLWLAFGSGSLPFAASVTATVLFAALSRNRVGSILGGVEQSADDLSRFAGLVERIERESFRSKAVLETLRRLETDGSPASRAIESLSRLVSLLDSSRNQMFAPIAFLLLWTTHLAWRVQRWRDRYGSDIARWVDAYADFEACCSIAGFAFEHPSYVTPELIEEGPLFDATGLGHPLIEPASLVTNDVLLSRDRCRILIVSGSNMSGKSTLLRTVGVNAVLAHAGARVCATRLRISRLRIGASIHVRDSLQDGRSRFYAEISRIRQIIAIADAGEPLLFLIDEILHGTNSHDRRIGARAVLLGLEKRGAIGLVTTHDLAITDVRDALESAARNVHFEDHLEGESMVFDYQLRDGVVTRSNALALMRRVGLDV